MIFKMFSPKLQELIKEKGRERREKVFTLVTIFIFVVILLYILFSGLSVFANIPSLTVLLLAVAAFLIIRGAMKGWPKKWLLILLVIVIIVIIILSIFLAASAAQGIGQFILLAILAVAFIAILGVLVFLFDLIFEVQD